VKAKADPGTAGIAAWNAFGEKKADGSAKEQLRPAPLLLVSMKGDPMKYSHVTLLAAVAAVTLISLGIPAATQAQSNALRAHIPFEFRVGDQVFAPGVYTVWRNGSVGAVSISDGNGHLTTSITNSISRPAARSAAESFLVFNVYGDRHFLREVRWAGYTEARGLLPSKAERQLARATRSADNPTAAIAAK
jgi:hypothetical protein